MVPPSVETRLHVLTLIANVLTRPEDYGDRFFVQIVRGSKNGYVPISLLRGMVSDLNDIPPGYFEHCADKEPHRLEISIDRSKVRLPRHSDDSNATVQQPETNPYGDHQQRCASTDDDGVPCTSEATMTAAPPPPPSPPSPPPTDTKTKTTTTTVRRFQPYEPRFASQRPVHPVIFHDGKFYSDSEPAKEAHLDRPTMDVPPYDKVKMDPLGADIVPSAAGPACFNCGKADHTLRDCPEPRDEHVIRERRKTAKAPPAFGRFFVELELRNKVAHCAPGQLSEALQDALGMNGLYPEPPYYAKMREHGYPPGYWGTPSSQKAVSWVKRSEAGWTDDFLYQDAPELKIYTDDSCYQKPATSADNDTAPPSKTKLVYYPGLYDNRSEQQQHYIPSTSTQPMYYQPYHYYHAYPPHYHYPAHPPPNPSAAHYSNAPPAPQLHSSGSVQQPHRVQETATPASAPAPAAQEESDDDMDISDGE